MRLTHHQIDIIAAEEAGAVHDIVSRQTNEQWLVAFSAIEMNQPIQWAACGKGQEVLIPLVPYLFQPRPDLALGFALQLGLRCAAALGRPWQRLHLALGTPVQEVEVDGQIMWRFYFGLGLVL